METDLSYRFSSFRKSFSASDVTPMEKKRLRLFYWFLKHVEKRITGIKNKTHFWGLVNNASYKESAAALKMGDFFLQ